MTIPGVELEALRRSLATPIAAIEPTEWGDARSTVRLHLLDGRDLAARHHPGPSGLATAEGTAAVIDRLAAEGVIVPQPVEVLPGASGAWLVGPWATGRSGRELLDGDASAVELGQVMGRLALALARVDAGGLPIDRTWSSPAGLAGAIEGWRRVVEGRLPRVVATRLADAATRLVGNRSIDDGPWAVGFAHGDLAPVNVVVTPDRGLVLLDFEHARVAPRLLDAAWWSWIVRYHHPERWPAAWPAFRTAAGIDRGPTTAKRLADIRLLMLLERAAAASDASARACWLGFLAGTIRWDDEG